MWAYMVDAAWIQISAETEMESSRRSQFFATTTVKISRTVKKVTTLVTIVKNILRTV